MKKIFTLILIFALAVGGLVSAGRTLNKDNAASAEDPTLDLSSKRLLLRSDEEINMTSDTEVLGERDGVYLVELPSEKAAEEALEHYRKTAVADPDLTFTAAEGEDVTVLNDSTNSFDELEASLQENREALPDGTIALIDSGASENANVIERVSVIGEEVGDDFGHGDLMIETILSENPDANIISIKALDENGEGSVSSIYAAMEYAIERGVSYINISASAYAAEESDVLINELEKTTEKGIIVVGSAGNNGDDAAHYVPGGLHQALVVGACDESGTRLESSNWGDTVDINAVATSTSTAAARTTGVISLNNASPESIEDLLTNLMTDDPGFYAAFPEEGTSEPENANPVFVAQALITSGTWYTNGSGVTATSSNYKNLWTYNQEYPLKQKLTCYAGYTGSSSNYHPDATRSPKINGFWAAGSKTSFNDIDAKYPIRIAFKASASSTTTMNRYVGDSAFFSALKRYNIVYNVNGGSGGPGTASAVKPHRQKYTLSTSKPTRTGYTFKNWNTAANGSGTAYASGGVVAYSAMNANTTIYAQWTANKYTVTLNQNGGTGGTASVSATYNSAMPSMTKPTRAGYIFEGYYDTSASTGGTQYYTAAGASARTWNKTANTTLYARWKADVSTVTFDYNGGNLDTVTEVLPSGQLTHTPAQPVREGYKFKGWIWEGDGTSKYVNLGRKFMYTDKISIHLDAWKEDWSEMEANNQRMISCTEGGGFVIESNANKTIQFTAYDSGVGYKNAITTSKWSDLTSGWHSFDMVFDGSVLKGYIDGEEVAVSPEFASGAIGYHATNSLLVGAEAAAADTPYGFYFNGNIANLAIENTDQIIARDYKIVSVPAAGAHTLKAWWVLETHYQATKVANKKEAIIGSTITWTIDHPLNTAMVDYDGKEYKSFKFWDPLPDYVRYDSLEVQLLDKNGVVEDADFVSKGEINHNEATRVLTWVPNDTADIPLEGGTLKFIIHATTSRKAKP